MYEKLKQTLTTATAKRVKKLPYVLRKFFKVTVRGDDGESYVKFILEKHIYELITPFLQQEPLPRVHAKRL